MPWGFVFYAMNKVTEKFFSYQKTPGQAEAAFKRAAAEAGFAPAERLFSGRVLHPRKVGSVIYAGTWRGCEAVLKVQLLPVEVSEERIIRAFNRQNRSTRIRLPEIFAAGPYRASRGFGYLVLERVKGERLYGSPLAGASDMDRFCSFYDEFRSKAVCKAFLAGRRPKTLPFVAERLDKWRRFAEQNRFLKFTDYAPYLLRFYRLAIERAPEIPMVFGHAHLSPDDIFATKEGGYVLMSNLFWQYRPRYYDLAFNVYTRIQQLSDRSVTFPRLVRYLKGWEERYRRLRHTRGDREFSRTYNFCLLERSVGAILVDVATNRTYGNTSSTQFQRSLKLNQQVFNHLYDQLTR